MSWAELLSKQATRRAWLNSCHRVACGCVCNAAHVLVGVGLSRVFGFAQFQFQQRQQTGAEIRQHLRGSQVLEVRAKLFNQNGKSKIKNKNGKVFNLSNVEGFRHTQLGTRSCQQPISPIWLEKCGERILPQLRFGPVWSGLAGPLSQYVHYNFLLKFLHFFCSSMFYFWASPVDPGLRRHLCMANLPGVHLICQNFGGHKSLLLGSGGSVQCIWFHKRTRQTLRELKRRRRQRGVCPSATCSLAKWTQGPEWNVDRK